MTTALLLVLLREWCKSGEIDKYPLLKPLGRFYMRNAKRGIKIMEVMMGKKQCAQQWCCMLHRKGNAGAGVVFAYILKAMKGVYECVLSLCSVLQVKLAATKAVMGASLQRIRCNICTCNRTADKE